MEKRTSEKKKYYGVRVGRKPGIYTSWQDCREQVIRFPGASYKGFATLQEAKAFMGPEAASGGREGEGAWAAGPETAPSAADAPPLTEESMAALTQTTAVAYVDGSYDPQTTDYACGAVIFYQGKEHRISKRYRDPEMAVMRNVSGEIMGAKEAIAYCIEERIPALRIYHDYEGVAAWAEGRWKTNKEGTRAYAAYCREAGRNLRLSFQKVKGHSGDRYNDLADGLAKTALGL